MSDEKPISRFAQAFVTRKLEAIKTSAYAGAEFRAEFENNFVDGVLELADRIRRPDLRRHLMNEATKSSEYLRQVHDSLVGAIRKTVWNGPWVETDEGRTIRGAVGLTHQGEYRHAEVSLYQEYGPTGRVSFSAESSKWNDKIYSYKEHAIFAARESIARALKEERHVEIPDEAEVRNAVTKYGGNDTQDRSITPPSRSR